MNISSFFQVGFSSIRESNRFSGKPAEDVSISNKQKKDLGNLVSISSEGRHAYESEKKPYLHGLENFKAPSWIANYLPKANDLSSSSSAIKETKKYHELDFLVKTDGARSDSGRKAIDSYRSNMKATQVMRDKDVYRQAYSNEIAEYVKYVQKSYEEAKSELGINTDQDYVDRVLNNSTVNETLHIKFKEKLYEHPRVSELMNILDVNPG